MGVARGVADIPNWWGGPKVPAARIVCVQREVQSKTKLMSGLTAGLSGLKTRLDKSYHGLHPWLQYGQPFRPFV